MKKNILFFLSLFSLFFAFSSCGSLENAGNTTTENNLPNTPIFSDNSTSNPEETKENNDQDQPTKNQDSKNETIKIASWNLYNFGKSKTDQQLEYIAKKLKDFDIVAIQEVSTSLYGIRAVAKLADQLNRTGSKWEYKISDPTSGEGTERYAYFWKPASKSGKITLKKDWLEESLAEKINREPYMARFEIISKSQTKNTVLMGSFHAVPTNKNPENEIIYLEEIPTKYKTDNILIMGDFNLSQKHAAFDVLRKRSLEAAFKDQKTSLRMKEKDDDALNAEYDNIFFETKAFFIKKAEVIHFYKEYESLKEARYVSDHIPVWVEIGFK